METEVKRSTNRSLDVQEIRLLEEERNFLHIKQWMEKIARVKQGEADLSQDEDLAIALMNLISLEEHFYFTAMKTNNSQYLEMLKSVRELRKNMMKRIVTSPKGEEWCISKHLLAASMRLMEVGTKELSKNGPVKADVFFRSSFDLFSLFFALNLGLVESKKLDSGPNVGNGYRMKFSEIIKKIMDCCNEW